jgi:preprotein translocase subunit SecD
VKGFAFTLGLSTLVDVIVVFIFTHPMVAWAARFRRFTSPRISGLGNLKHDGPATSPIRAASLKES